MLGGVKQWTGHFSGGFFLLSLVGFSSAVALVYVSRAWEGIFIGKGGLATNIAADGPETIAVAELSAS